MPSKSAGVVTGGTYFDSEKENDPTYQYRHLDHKKTNKESRSTTLRRVKKPGNLTPAEQKFYRNLLKLTAKISKYKNKTKKQSAALRAAKCLTSNEQFLKVMENLPSAARILTIMQIRQVKKKDKGRRFTLQEKIFALSIFKQDPRVYRFLRKNMILPSPQTLSKLINEANVVPGINKNVFKQIQKQTLKMKMQEKLCILLFDEMSLKPNVAYNERKDKIVGFVTDGVTTRPEYADHAQVFMVRGLVKNYKMPISYTLSASATKGLELAKQIKNNKELQKAGLIIVAMICDQGANNRAAVKYLLEETRGELLRKGQESINNLIVINDQKIVPLYDPPHMLKCIRNNLISKNLQYKINGEIKTAKWEHIMLLHKENPGYKGMRLIPILTDHHVIPHKIAKMKVKYASQVFSQALGKNMGFLAGKGILPKECEDTADLILFFDNLFDSFNGSFKKKYVCKTAIRGS